MILDIEQMGCSQQEARMKTYAAVQHGPQQISIDALLNGKYLHQVSYWFRDRATAKAELGRLCAADNVQAHSKYVIGLDEIK